MKLRILAVIGVFLIASNLSAQIAPPPLINYQGRVLAGGTNFDGTGQFKFALVSGNGATTYWSNDGTSTNGSQPTNAVPLTVVNGLYSVLLGDTSLSNMTAVPASVFSNSDVRLRIWFNDGSHGSELLTPDQRIGSVGYALLADNVKDGAINSAKLASGAVKTANIDPGAVGTNQLSSTAVQTANILGGAVTNAKLANSSFTLTLGGGLTGSATATLGGSVSLGTNATSSNVASTIVSRDSNGSFSVGGLAIGTNTPFDSVLEVNGNIHLDWNDLFLGHGQLGDHNHGLGYYGAAISKTFAGQSLDGPVLYGYEGGALGIRRDNIEAIALRWDASGNATVAGNIAASSFNISGTGTAGAFAGQSVMLSGSAPLLKMIGPGGAGAHATVDLSTYDPGANAPSARLLATDNNFGSDIDILTKTPGASTNGLNSRLRITAAGNVGIGTTTPSEKLEVNGNIRADGNLTASSANSLLFTGSSSSAGGSWLQLNNISTGGHSWNIISSGSGNGEGAGKLLFNDQTTLSTRMMIDNSGASIAGDLNVTGRVSAMVPKAKITQNGPQTFANFSLVRIRFDTAEFASGVTFDDANDQLVILSPGVYQITATLSYAANATSWRFLRVETGAQGEIASVTMNAVAGLDSRLFVTTLLSLDTGDTVFVTEEQNSGASLNSSSQSRAATLSVLWIGP